MTSPGIDKWIANAPESWAKLAKDAKKQASFEQFKKQFFEGAEKENKGYLKEYLKEEQLKYIYTQGFGGKIELGGTGYTPIKPSKITIQRKNTTYVRSVTPKWDLKTKYVLQLAIKEKPRTKQFNTYVEILMKQGRTRQAVIKKIQRTRKELNK